MLNLDNEIYYIEPMRDSDKRIKRSPVIKNSIGAHLIKKSSSKFEDDVDNNIKSWSILTLKKSKLWIFNFFFRRKSAKR